MTEPQNAPAQPAAPSSYPAYDPAADDKLLYSIAAAAVALPLVALAFLVFASRGSKAPFRFGAKGILDKAEFNDYLKTGSFRANATVKFKHPVEKIWQVLTGEHAFSWLPGVKGVHYVGTPGEGAVRYLKTLPLALGEQVVEYEEGKVFGYTGTGASLPVLKHLASQYNFEPTKRGGTKVTWKLAATPKVVGFLPLWLAGPLAKPALKVALRLANSTIFPADKK
ncbi:Polyketide cyclase/dehydrase [Segniliparus rotundus DSM 44985]|uniref:Polyketide cyclase/dehydrase n=1 Tax=Segniliparus rotundus (strain ATCC BAA-972 / CDC 1076 / CIP 108378 / DSM 44985 / JCM 13578) TaxID=640132 RepID=D6ZF91_SEGRD|nr:SRPBCC family protein [Segniliparus rotundus]ADG97615.1 Polyketide cyclase/dehydrase [Segniliparus rotundus DSM 44985]